MRRFHLFEFGDQLWMPKIFRRCLHELLQYQVSSFYSPLLPNILTWLKANKIDEITDLASGAGGPWVHLIHEIRKEIPSFQVYLSDIAPRVITGFKYIDKAIDLRRPACLPSGGLTVFTGFHHLKPVEARAFLETVFLSKQPIFIAEFVERKPSKIIGMLFSPLVVFIDTLKMKPFSFLRILFTYLIPVIPLIYLWDGAVSHARAYSTDDLEQMILNFNSSDYSFECIRVMNQDHGVHLTCFYSVSGLISANKTNIEKN